MRELRNQLTNQIGRHAPQHQPGAEDQRRDSAALDGIVASFTKVQHAPNISRKYQPLEENEMSQKADTTRRQRGASWSVSSLGQALKSEYKGLGMSRR